MDTSCGTRVRPCLVRSRCILCVHLTVAVLVHHRDDVRQLSIAERRDVREMRAELFRRDEAIAVRVPNLPHARSQRSWGINKHFKQYTVNWGMARLDVGAARVREVLFEELQGLALRG